MSRLYLIACIVICLLPARIASAADPIESFLEPHDAVLAKLDALRYNNGPPGDREGPADYRLTG